jgi:hypothetical protein
MTKPSKHGKRAGMSLVSARETSGPVRTAAEIDRLLLASPPVRWAMAPDRTTRCPDCLQAVDVMIRSRTGFVALFKVGTRTRHACPQVGPAVASLPPRVPAQVALSPKPKKQKKWKDKGSRRSARGGRRVAFSPTSSSDCPQCGKLLAGFGEYKSCFHCGS